MYNASQLKELVDAYSQVSEFVFDVETIGELRVDPRQNKVAWVALATGDRVDVIPCGHPNGDFIRNDMPLLAAGVKRLEKGLPLREMDYSKDARKAVPVFTAPPAQLTAAQVFRALKPLFLDPEVLKIGHNVTFDVQSITKYLGEMPSTPYFCTMVASFVLDSRNKMQLGLDDCLAREFDHKMVKGVGKNVALHSFDEVATYAAEDARWTYQLYKVLAARLATDRALKPFMLDMDLLEVTSSMELAGAPIHMDQLKVVKDHLEISIEDAKANIYSTAGKAFNINSNPEKQLLLFTPKKDGGRGLRGRILTPAGKLKYKNGQPLDITDYSVSAEALEMFRNTDPLVDALLEYADLNKLMTTYVIPYAGGDVTRTTGGKEKTTYRASMLVKGRIHTQYMLTAAETGRLASRSPNLQNIPNPRTTNGKAIRNLFVAPDGYQMVMADYSQIEPRVIASLSEDPTMMNAYFNGEDLYTAIGNPLGVSRDAAKVLMLSMSYGVGPDKVAASIGITLREAKALLDEFAHKFKHVQQFRSLVIREGRSRRPVPYVKTMVGRRRYLPDLLSSEYGLKARAERQAFNTVIQGSAADIIKIAMVRAHRMLPTHSTMILTVHDELVTLAPDEYVLDAAQAIRDAMQNIHVLKVPLLCDLKIVTKWGDAK